MRLGFGLLHGRFLPTLKTSEHVAKEPETIRLLGRAVGVNLCISG